MTKIAHVRHYIFLLPGIFLFTSIIVSQLSKNSKWMGLFSAFILIGSQLPLINYYHIEKKPEWRLASDFVSSKLQPQDLLLMSATLNPGTYLYYLERKSKQPIKPIIFKNTADANHMCELMRSHQKAALIRNGSADVLKESILEKCGSEFNVSTTVWYMVAVDLWTPKPS